MDLSNNTILITGGGSGIGLALAERFQQAGSQVVICGRRAETLEKIKAAHRGFHTRVADVSTAAGRQQLTHWATATFPALNVLVNNAGIQRRIRLQDDEPWDETHTEIA